MQSANKQNGRLMADILEQMNDELNDIMSSPDPRARFLELQQLQREQEERDVARHQKEAQERREKDPYYWKGLYEREVQKAIASAARRKEAALTIGFAVTIITLSLLIGWVVH
jgi:hypothetical protein